MKGTRRLLSVLIFSVTAFAEPVAQLHPGNYVNDFAHVLSATTVEQLNDTCHQIDDKARAQIAVVTIQSLDGRDIEGYAVDLFKQWGIGSKSTNRGVLILVAVQDHRYRTEVGYGLEPILPDGKVGGFGREAVPYFRQNEYNGGIKLMTLRVADVIAKDAGIQLTGSQLPQQRQPDSIPISPIAIFILLLVLGGPLIAVLWAISRAGGGRRGGWGTGGWGAGTWGGGGWGGGGWGGGFGGGGGGFGGFGGGSSGGGGASGSW